MSEVLLSFLTPTYNRARTLPRVWESLNRQQETCFEWVVVDDGSEDETPDLVERWSAEAPFPVVYHRKENGGKNSALNVGMGLVSGDYIVPLDSDDALLDDAVAVIRRYLESTGIADDPDLVGLAFRCVDDHGSLVGPPLPQPTIRCSHLEAFYRYKIRSELFGVTKTEVMRRLEFTEVQPPEHVPEGVAYEDLPVGGECVYIDHPLRRYYRDDGQPRLTDKQDRGKHGIKWAWGKYLHRRAILNHEVAFFLADPKFFLRTAVRMSRYGLHIGRPLSEQFRELTNLSARLLWMAGLLPGLLKYRKDLRRSRAGSA